MSRRAVAKSKIRTAGVASICASLLALAVAASPSFAAGSFEEKEKQIVEASESTISRLTELRGADNLNIDTARKIIEERISPHFDFTVLTRAAVGKSWRKANDDQKKELTDLFRMLIEKTYSVALSKYSDQSISHEPGSARGGKGTVSVFVDNDGSKVEIEYLLAEADGKWNITDVRFEKVSLLGNYRRQFNAIVRKDGIDGLIKTLRDKV